MAGFIFGGNTGISSPQELQRKREIAQALAMGSVSRAPKNVGEGLNSIAQALIARSFMKEADAAEKVGQEKSGASMANILASLGGQPFPDAPTAPGGGPGGAPAFGQPAVSGDMAAPAGGDWLRYANQGATRNLPLDEKMVNAMSFLPDIGVSMEVFSGGQPEAGKGPRVGSTRHDHGNAADVFFYKDGRKLDWANPEDLPVFEDIVARAKAAGLTGFGAGPGYMQPGSMHLGFGAPGAWGADGRGSNAPEWLRNAALGPPAPGGQELPSREVRDYPVAQAASPASPPLNQIPPMAGGTAGTFQAGQGPTVQMLLQAAQSPWLNENQRGIVNMLLGRQMDQSDPMKQLQRQKLEAEIGALKAKPAITPTDDQRELEQINKERTAAGLPTLRMDEWITARSKSGATTVNVNGEPSDGALRKKLDEETGKLWSGYQQTGATSAALAQDMQVLDELIKIAPQGPVSGRLAEMFPGVSSAGDAFQSIVKRIAPTLRAPGSGATSDIEYEGMLKSLPALRNNPEANAVISAIMKGKAAINIERSGVIDAYGRGEITAGKARERIADIDKRSIMTPEMKQMLSGMGANAGPAEGVVEDGYRFKGGDPSDPKNWERVQ